MPWGRQWSSEPFGCPAEAPVGSLDPATDVATWVINHRFWGEEYLTIGKTLITLIWTWVSFTLRGTVHVRDVKWFRLYSDIIYLEIRFLVRKSWILWGATLPPTCELSTNCYLFAVECSPTYWYCASAHVCVASASLSNGCWVGGFAYELSSAYWVVPVWRSELEVYHKVCPNASALDTLKKLWTSCDRVFFFPLNVTERFRVRAD